MQPALSIIWAPGTAETARSILARGAFSPCVVAPHALVLCRSRLRGPLWMRREHGFYAPFCDIPALLPSARTGIFGVSSLRRCDGSSVRLAKAVSFTRFATATNPSTAPTYFSTSFMRLSPVTSWAELVSGCALLLPVLFLAHTQPIHYPSLNAYYVSPRRSLGRVTSPTCKRAGRNAGELL